MSNFILCIEYNPLYSWHSAYNECIWFIALNTAEQHNAHCTAHEFSSYKGKFACIHYYQAETMHWMLIILLFMTDILQ